jgi:hypothetical protein
MKSRPERPEHVALLVQRVADGAASEQELERFAAMLDKDPDLALEVEEIQALGGAIRQELMDAAAQVDFRALQARVFQGIAADAQAARRPSAWERLVVSFRETLEHQGRFLAPIGAVAAAALVAVGLPRLADRLGDPSQVTPPEGSNMAAAAEIHSLDTEDTTAVVFQAPGSSVTVIWLTQADDVDDDDAAEEALDQELPGSDVPPEVEAVVAPDDATATQ